MALKAGYKGFKTLGPGLDYDSVTGHLFLNGESDISLDNLKDVSIDTPVDGDILIYDSTTETWYNEQIDSDPVEDSSKPVSSGGVYAAITATQNLIDDTVGWISEQLYKLSSALVFPITNNGVTYTYTDGIISADGATDSTAPSSLVMAEAIPLTQGQKVYFGGGVSNTIRLNLFKVGGSDEVLVGANPIVWTVPSTGNYRIQIWINKNTVVDNVTFNPILLSHPSVDTQKADNSVIAPVENGTTASQSYSANDFFMHNGELYIATTSIAQGATFTEGTNCTKKTIGEVLTALLNA